MMTYNPALGVVPMHWRTTTVLYLWTSLLWISLLVDFTFVDFTMWTTPDGDVCVYVCMYVHNDRTDHKETQNDGSGEGGLANIL